MDLNIKSPIVWEFYRNTLQTLAGYGAVSYTHLDVYKRQDIADIQLKLKHNKESERSPFFGFMFAASGVTTEMSARCV